MYFSDETLKASRRLSENWQAEVGEALKTAPDRKSRFSTVSDLDIQRLYTPEDMKTTEFARDIGAPGEFPYLRGNQATGYGAALGVPHVSDMAPPRTPTPLAHASAPADWPFDRFVFRR